MANQFFVEQPPLNLDPEVVAYLERQMILLQDAIQSRLDMDAIEARPTKIQNGMLRYSDGLGEFKDGPGFYGVVNGEWIKIHSSDPIDPPDPEKPPVIPPPIDPPPIDPPPVDPPVYPPGSTEPDLCSDTFNVQMIYAMPTAKPLPGSDVYFTIPTNTYKAGGGDTVRWGMQVPPGCRSFHRVTSAANSWSNTNSAMKGIQGQVNYAGNNPATATLYEGATNRCDSLFGSYTLVNGGSTTFIWGAIQFKGIVGELQRDADELWNWIQNGEGGTSECSTQSGIVYNSCRP